MATQAATRSVDHLTDKEAYRAYLEEHGQRPGNKEAFGFRSYYYDHWDVPEGARILDLGCYVGATAIHYAELGHEVIGVDGSDAYIQQANLNAWHRPGLLHRLLFTRCLFEDYEVEDPFHNLFGACCCTEALQQCIDPTVVVAKAYECLRDGGTFFCTVPARNDRGIDQAELADLLLTAGFTIKQLFHLAPVPKAGVPQLVAEGIK